MILELERSVTEIRLHSTILPISRSKPNLQSVSFGLLVGLGMQIDNETLDLCFVGCDWNVVVHSVVHYDIGALCTM